MKDHFNRTIDYMRISITDRCNLRCRYCMPDGCEKVPMDRILTYEEIERICRIAARLGIRKIKITGGEPFVRLGCTDLIRTLKSIDGIDSVTVTTNGQILSRYMDDLKDAGVDGINISLDTLDPQRYAYITGGGSLDRVLEAIRLAAESGIPTKVCRCCWKSGRIWKKTVVRTATDRQSITADRILQAESDLSVRSIMFSVPAATGSG